MTASRAACARPWRSQRRREGCCGERECILVSSVERSSCLAGVARQPGFHSTYKNSLVLNST